MYSMWNWKTAKSLGKFLCFGASGEVSVRDLIGTCDDALVLRKEQLFFSYWPPQETVPLDRKARLFMAKLIHRRLHKEFVEWRQQHKIRTPSLKAHEAQIEEVV